MCILVLKKKGSRFPSINEIKNCVRANPDGFSMSWNADGRLHTYKTMDAEAFMKMYCDIVKSLDRKTTAMMIHARIATHGSKRIGNCHCWSGKVLGAEMSFAHNGILRIPNRGDMTDSETFLRDYLEPCKGICDFLDTIERNIGSSKFGFLNGDGAMIHFGHFIDERGVMFSNYSYMRSHCNAADPRFWGRMSI